MYVVGSVSMIDWENEKIFAMSVVIPCSYVSLLKFGKVAHQL